MINVEMNMHRSTRFVILSEQSEAKDDKWRGSAYSLSRGDTPGWPLLPFGQFTSGWPPKGVGRLRPQARAASNRRRRLLASVGIRAEN